MYRHYTILKKTCFVVFYHILMERSKERKDEQGFSQIQILNRHFLSNIWVLHVSGSNVNTATDTSRLPEKTLLRID